MSSIELQLTYGRAAQQEHQHSHRDLQKPRKRQLMLFQLFLEAVLGNRRTIRDCDIVTRLGARETNNSSFVNTCASENYVCTQCCTTFV